MGTGTAVLDIVGGILVAIAAVVALVAFAVVALTGTIDVGTVALAAGLSALGGAIVGGVVGRLTHADWEGALRGAFIGLTAGVNGAVGTGILGAPIGIGLAVITALALVPVIAQSDVYQAVLGWTSYVSPMSWPGHVAGLFMFLLNDVAGLVTAGRSEDLKLHGLRVDWKTGTIATLGGWVARLAPGRLPAYTIGGFSWFDYDDTRGRTSVEDGLLDHEAGHMLNNAAFGLVQVINALPDDHDSKYFEKLAESNAPSSRGYARSDQWGMGAARPD